MQVDPIKPILKAPGTKHLKLKCDELLSSFAFKLNLHHYSEEPQPSEFAVPGEKGFGEELCKTYECMTNCKKPLRHFTATSSTKSSKWSVLIGRAGTKAD